MRAGLLLAGHPVALDQLLRVALIVVSIEAQSCSWSRCNEGCESFVSVTGHLASAPSDLSGATVMLCSKCSSGTVGAGWCWLAVGLCRRNAHRVPSANRETSTAYGGHATQGLPRPFARQDHRGDAFLG
jgi:hypothetical protein